MTRLFARHSGRHCRRRFWQHPLPVAELVVDDFSRPRQALAPFPLSDTGDLIPFRRNPYSPKDAA